MAVNLDSLTVAQLFNNSRPFIGVEDSLQTYQQPANGPYLAKQKLGPQLTWFNPQSNHLATLAKQCNLLY
jgi:hypothetical protein